MAIRCVNEIPVYEEVDGEEQIIADGGVKVMVQSHPTVNTRIVLVVDGKKRIVEARDLTAAVQNATNV